MQLFRSIKTITHKYRDQKTGSWISDWPWLSFFFPISSPGHSPFRGEVNVPLLIPITGPAPLNKCYPCAPAKALDWFHSIAAPANSTLTFAVGSRNLWPPASYWRLLALGVLDLLPKSRAKLFAIKIKGRGKGLTRLF